MQSTTSGVDSKLHILVVEDDEADFELIQHELAQGGLATEMKRVDVENDLFQELHERPPDLVLSDNALVNTDSFTVLKFVRDRCPDVPFIVVTGGMSDATLVELIASGADDFVFKHRLGELVPAIRRALRHSEERRRLRQIETERDQLRREVTRLRKQLCPGKPAIPSCRSCRNVRPEGRGWESLEDYCRQEHGWTFNPELCPDCVELYFSVRV